MRELLERIAWVLKKLSLRFLNPAKMAIELAIFPAPGLRVGKENPDTAAWVLFRLTFGKRNGRKRVTSREVIHAYPKKEWGRFDGLRDDGKIACRQTRVIVGRTIGPKDEMCILASIK